MLRSTSPIENAPEGRSSEALDAVTQATKQGEMQ